MRSPRLTTADDHALAHDLAERAGRLLLDLRAKGGDPALLKDAGDRSSHATLAAALTLQGCGPGSAARSPSHVTNVSSETA